jgi:phosphoribosylanthranilate isomerase
MDNNLLLPPNHLFNRIQINLRPHMVGKINLNSVQSLLHRPEFIIQYRGRDEEKSIVKDIPSFNSESKNSFAVLFDASGGKGLLPENWLPPFSGMRCGYAGGLNPDNLQEQLVKIAKIANGQSVWADMETGVRTDNRLDLEKVRRCLEIAKPWT